MSIYPRERISEALQNSANRGVAMLIAPAGFGKSEAAADAWPSRGYTCTAVDAGISTIFTVRESPPV